MRRRGYGISIAAFLVSATTLSPLAIDHADAQQGAVSQNANSSAATENNGQDFTRPQNLLQLRYIYQTAPGSGSEPGTIRTVTTDREVLRSDLKIDVARNGHSPCAAICRLWKETHHSRQSDGEFIGGLGNITFKQRSSRP